jgi:hypothetical protein
VHPKYKNQIVDKIIHERKQSDTPYFTSAVSLAIELNAYDELRSVDCHVYNGRWDDVDGREVDTDLNCRQFLIFIETFRKNLRAPSVVKNVKVEQIMQALQSK